MNPAEPLTPWTGRPARLVSLVLAVGAALVAFSFAFTPLRSSQDEWWHLKAGQWMWQNGRLPEFDIFTYTGEATPWHNHEWLSQLAMYGVYSLGEGRALGGVRALILAKALLFAGTILLLAWHAWRRCGDWVPAALLAVLAAEISRRTIYPRPPVLSYLLFAGWLVVWNEWKSGRLRGRWLWLLIPAMVLWANLHGMCLLGIVVAGAYAAGELLEWVVRRRDREVAQARRRGFLLAGAVTAALVLAAMASPSGWNIFFLGGRFMNDPVLKQVIAEMLPPPFFLVREGDGWTFVPGFATYWFVLAAVAVLLVWNRLRLPCAADYLLLGFFALQSVRHWRLLPLFALAAAGPAAWLIAERLRGLGERTRRAAVAGVAALAVCLGGLYVFAVGEPPPQTFFRRNMQLARGQSTDAFSYPEETMRFVIEADLPDRMFSELNYCGYFIWRLSPEHHKLFTDNRFDIWGSEHFIPHEIIRMGAEPQDTAIGKGWRDLLDEYGVNFLVLSRASPLHAKLRTAPDWWPIHYHLPLFGGPDSGFAVWLRASPDHEATRERAAEIFARDNPGEPTPERFEQGPR